MNEQSLDEKNFEVTKKNGGKLVVVLSVIAGFQMAVNGPFSDQKGLARVQVRQVGEWAGILRLLPSQNAQAAAKRLV